jgi:membrane protease YdiL (CAAX protease family)
MGTTPNIRGVGPRWLQHVWVGVLVWILLAVGIGLGAYAFASPMPTASRVLLILVGISLLEGAGALAMIRRGLVNQALSTPGRPLAYLVGFFISAAFVTFTIAGNAFVRDHFLALVLVKLTAIPVAISAGTCEELIFRGLLMDRLQRRGMSSVVQVLVSGAAFGGAHFYAFGGLATAISAQVATTILGFGLAVVYLLAGRRLWPAIISHGLVDLAIEPWLIDGFFP